MDKKNDQVSITTPKKIKGTWTIFGNGDVELHAQGEGQAQQEVLARKGNSKLYKTNGESPKIVAHLMTAEDAADVENDLRDLLEDFMKGFSKKKELPKPEEKDRVLWSDDVLNIWLDADKRKVFCSLSLSLDGGKNLEQQALLKFQNVYQCFTINKHLLARAVSARKKSSSD